MLGAAVTRRGQGEESVEEGTYDHEGWQACHFNATEKGGQSAEIYREITAGHDINNTFRVSFPCTIFFSIP